jgi:hypothetical protein
MLWITISQPPLVATPNCYGEKCVAKTSWNWKHKTQRESGYNVSSTTMGQTPPKCLVMAKSWAAPKTHVI